jgi:hypothetical protein
MRVIVVDAGHVGQTALESVHAAHECTVIDVDGVRLQALSHESMCGSWRAMAPGGRRYRTPGVARAELLLACTSATRRTL